MPPSDETSVTPPTPDPNVTVAQPAQRHEPDPSATVVRPVEQESDPSDTVVSPSVQDDSDPIRTVVRPVEQQDSLTRPLWYRCQSEPAARGPPDRDRRSLGRAAGSPSPARPHRRRARTPSPDFEIERELGRGGMGVVYKATQTGLGRTVALKMLIAGQYADPGQRARFLLEAESVAALEHPHIIRVFAFGESGGHPYLAMEFVPGGTLSEAPQGPAGRFHHEKRPNWSRDWPRRWRHAHSRGIVHRDIGTGVTSCSPPRAS